MSLKQESFTTWVVKGTFFKDERTTAVEGEFGPLATLLIMRVWNELYLRKSHRIGKMIWRGLAKSLNFDEAQADRLLAMLCHKDVGYLLIDENNEIGSDSVDEKCSLRCKERETWRNNKRDGKKTDISKDVPNTFQSSSTMERPTLTPTPTLTNLNNNSAPQKPDYSQYEPEERRKLETAESMLISGEDQKVSRSNHYMMAGRRPMKKWPEIWLSPQELVKVLDFFEEVKFEKKHRHRALDLVSSRIKTKMADGVQPERISAFNWITGFQGTEIMQQIKAEKDMQRSGTYLDNARTQ